MVSTLDTLPACEPVPWSLCGWSACSRWDVLPVACGLVAVVSVGVGCAACGQFPRYPASGEGVAVVSVGVGWSACVIGCRGQFPRYPASGKPVAVVSVSDGVPWSVPSTHCQR